MAARRMNYRIRIRRCIDRNPGISKAGIIDKMAEQGLQIKLCYVNRVLNTMVSEGIITITEDGGYRS